VDRVCGDRLEAERELPSRRAARSSLPAARICGQSVDATPLVRQSSTSSLFRRGCVCRNTSVCSFVLTYHLTDYDASHLSSFYFSCQCLNQLDIILEGGKSEFIV
jgi:hypothetical protein